MYHTGIVMTQQSEINEKNYVTPQALKYNESFIYIQSVSKGAAIYFLFLMEHPVYFGLNILKF